MYLAFPIGWMYYFGTNLDRKFTIPEFWPTQEQSHKIPTERDDIRKEVQRIQGQIRERKLLLQQQDQNMGEDGSRVLEAQGKGQEGELPERRGGLGR